ncbi:LPS assembly lipoprotein LptE [Sagittula salina]|uniref:LPS-assembly lipoprotein n=1 Tax=Sagittula salina TaxID=2820268 RepID=A0A940S140_9RHOB|nr:LPS assembly lipoprotein LptE [Sagittula salina]MBP0483738.1 hypothetical protein [Sagittula salina]
MWWSETDRKNGVAGPSRRLLLGALLAVAGCGFTPVYGPEGAGTALLGKVALTAPGNDNTYAFNRRFEERLGRAREAAPYGLSLRIETDTQDIGATSTGYTNRIRLIGRASYALIDASTGKTLHTARTNAFTGYSTTGSTVATRAAQRDATERLMVILADQVIDDLLLHTTDLPGPAT